MPVSNFHIDASQFNVQPSPIQIKSGGSQIVVIGTTYPAPEGGLAIDIKTDIPSSVIMDEVILQAEENSVSIRIEGGQAGSGRLFISAPGFNEKTVPIQVTR